MRSESKCACRDRRIQRRTKGAADAGIFVLFVGRFIARKLYRYSCGRPGTRGGDWSNTIISSARSADLELRCPSARLQDSARVVFAVALKTISVLVYASVHSSHSTSYTSHACFVYIMQVGWSFSGRRSRSNMRKSKGSRPKAVLGGQRRHRPECRQPP